MSTSQLAKQHAASSESHSTEALHLITQAPRRRRTGGRWLLFSAGGVAVVFLIAWASDRLPGRTHDLDVKFQTHEVERGPLEITVVEQGNLESTSNVDIRCEVEGGRIGSGGGGGGGGSGTQIIWIYKEGEFVSQGEKIVELDQSGLKQQEIEQQIAYETARQALITSKNTYEAAKIAVDEYLHGTFPKEMELVEAEITVAKENLRRAEAYAKYSEQLYQKGFQTLLTLEADQFAVANAKLTLQAAETKKKSLQDFTKKKMTADLESLRDSAEASMRAADSKFKLEENKLEQIRDQIEKCTILAPRDGMVIYASDRDRRGRSDSVEIKEGALVRLRQVIIQLPDLTHMQVRAKVHESMIERVKKGQKVNIRIDALNRLTLHGEVQTINNQPEPGSWMSSNVKEYGVLCSIDEAVENLKPGMTAEVEIEINRLDDVLAVPVQAVVQKGEQSYCYTVGDDGFVPRPIELGDTNDVLIEIKEGLNAGDRVVLNPRLVVPEAREQGSQLELRKNGNGNGKGKRLDVEAPMPGEPDKRNPANAEGTSKPKGKKKQRDSSE
jgi:RND family efflux transporter MFP subunit